MSVHDTPEEHGKLEDWTDLPRDLMTILKTRKFPNALLFIGKKGMGKKEAALKFTRAANCQKEKGCPSLPCNRCNSCRKMLANMHPDIIRVFPVKERIKISQIRELYDFIKVKPHEAKMRMVLIEEADTMNKEASNALLKILEEPPKSTFFVLTAEKIDTLLPTILSRCRQLIFKPLSREKIKQTLINTHGIDKGLAEVTSSWCDGSLKKALGLLNLSNDSDGTDWLKRRHWLLNLLGSLIKGGKENIGRTLLLLGERLSQEPELLQETLALLYTFFRDIAVFRYNPGAVVNMDYSTLLQDLAHYLQPESALAWIKELHDVEKKIAANAGVRLTLEAFFFKLIPAGQMP